MIASTSVVRRVIVLLAALSFGSVPAVSAAEPIHSLAELRTRREQAAARPRRVIFNNDGNEPVYLCKTTSPEEFLGYRTTPLVGSNVDAIFYCTWSSGFGVFTHDTKVGQVFSSREGLFARNLAPEMIAAGTDPLRVMTGFGHQHGIEVFWSFRLNDTHDGSSAEYGPIMFRANRLKLEHPDWLIGTKTQRPKFGAWSAVDFTRAEIRELAFRYVEEVCQRYDVDGVEIDFFRHPVFFKRAAQTGTECNDAERQLMTELLQRIRKMTEQEGLRRGRPLLVAIRVPDSVEYCRAIGIDLERWLGDKLVDLLVTAGYFQINDPAYTVSLGRKYGVKVYPSLDEPRLRDVEARKLRATTAAYRGRALNAWRAGVDGVYLFNSFNPKDPIWRELGSPATLVDQERDYFASVLGLGAAAGGAYPHGPFMSVPQLNPSNPIALKPGTAAATMFYSGERAGGTPPGTTAVLRLQFKAAPPVEQITALLNEEPLRQPRLRENWIEFDVNPRALLPGANHVEVKLAANARAAAWTDLWCRVSAGKAK